MLVALPLAILAGCGGGGGGGTSVRPTAAPTIAPTATLGSLILVVQLRDSARQPVDGIVTVGTSPPMATIAGNATFNRGVTAGAATVSAEVDGVVTTGTATVNATGSTVYTLTIAPSVTPAPTTTLPPPPF